MQERKNIKYLVKSNNYVGLLFFALVLASLLYIIKHETKTLDNLEPTIKEIEPVETPKEITEQTEEIKNLQNYLTTGDPNTFKIYQSFYVYNDKVTIENINQETLLYLGYKYIESTTDFTNHTKYITCDQATLIGLNTLITQCGGTKVNTTYYTVNSYITKEQLRLTIQKLFNQNITNYTNFYTSEDNLCYFINDEYLCVSHQTKPTNINVEKQFVKAYKYNTKIEIIEKYKYIKDGIYYKGFNSNEVGEGYYKTTFNKVNGSYYWTSTEYIEKTS